MPPPLHFASLIVALIEVYVYYVDISMYEEYMSEKTSKWNRMILSLSSVSSDSSGFLLGFCTASCWYFSLELLSYYYYFSGFTLVCVFPFPFLSGFSLRSLSQLCKPK